MKVSKRHPAYREENLGIEFTGSHSYLNKEDEGATITDFLYSVRSNVLFAKLFWLVLGAAFASPFLYFGYNFINLVVNKH